MGGGYTKSAPREWTDKEIEWITDLHEQGFSNKEIAESTGRTEISIQIKLKRLSKNARTYADSHIIEKYDTNAMYMLMIRPNSVLDVFAGLESWYLGRVDNLVTNDKEQEADTTYHKDAFSLMCMLYDKGETFDVIDLDPFGSAYDCFDLAIKMAKKGLVITFGELGHKRWKRLDYVRNHYGIYNINDFTLSRLIEYVQSIGRRNKKQLNVVFRKEWQNIGRVWFEIERYKTTEQWGIDNKEEKTYVATGRFQMLIDAEDDYEAANILFDTHNITFSDVEIREDETG